MKINFDKLLTDAKDYHLPFAGVVFAVGSALQYFHHLDASYVAFCGTVLGAITGHAFSPAQGNGDAANTAAGPIDPDVAPKAGGSQPVGSDR